MLITGDLPRGVARAWQAIIDGNGLAGIFEVMDGGTVMLTYHVAGDARASLPAQRAIEFGRDPVTGRDLQRWDGLVVVVSDHDPRVAGSTAGFKFTSRLYGVVC